MKKLFALLTLFLVSATFFKAQAYQGDPSQGDYTTDTTITINLKAAPQGTENAVSIDLAAVGLTILSYTPPAGNGWIGNTADCDNSQIYSTDRVCTSLAKTSAITAGESLGTITVLVKGSTYATLTKTSENSYSDGKTIRTDSGVLAEFNKTYQSQNVSSSTQNINLNIDANAQPIILLIAIVVIAILAFLMILPRIRRSARNKNTPSSPF